MSLSCPQCGSALGGDFGVVVCTNCRAVCSIDLDGHIRTSLEEGAENPFENPRPEALDSLQTVDSDSSSQSGSGIQELSPEEGKDFNLEESPQATRAELSELFVQELAEAPALDMNLEHENAMEKWAQSDAVQANVSQTEGPSSELVVQEVGVVQTELALVEPPRTHRPDLSLSEEVKAFAEKDSDHGFAWTFDLEIHCLGSTSTRPKLESLLATPHLSLKDTDKEWDETRSVMLLRELNPAQAAVLQRELERLRVQLIWRQNVLSIGSHDALRSPRQRCTKDS
ncbi:MAG: hypothetical protein WCH11_03730 [Bdellovibrio sp.]